MAQIQCLFEREGHFPSILSLSSNTAFLQVCASVCATLWQLNTHPEPSSVHRDLAAGLLLPLPPLHQVEPVVNGQGDVPLAHRGVDRSCQEVRLGVQGHLHSVGQHQPHGAVETDEVAVSDLF